MALISTSTKNLMNEYHRLAADTLLGQRHSHLSEALLSAAEDGQYDRLQTLLSDPHASLDARCPLTGDTPLIAAARNGHERVVQLLVEMGADLTLSNDLEESALEVASAKLRKIMLSSIDHDGRTMSNAQALLQNAWLGDAVSVKKHLSSGNHYLDVNCSNNDGMTPLLLVTRDINLFDSIQAAMETNYNPVNVVQDLIDNHADISHCDPKGRSVLHFVATSEGVHARKMVSLLMRTGSKVDSLDHQLNSPLHIASGKGHTSIIIALVEEGGADVNSKGGERNDTPLMLTARAGHSEAARYLLAKGADVTAVDDNGDSALTVATTHSMVSLLKEAWIEQTTTSKSEGNMLSSDDAESAQSPPITAPESPQSLSNRSFFLTDQRLSQSFTEPLTATTHVMSGHEEQSPDHGSCLTPRPLRVSGTSTEGDDELDGSDDITTSPPIKQSPQRHTKRHSVDTPKASVEPLEADLKSRSLPRNLFTALSRVSEVKGQETSTRRGSKGRIKDEKKLKQSGKKGDKKRPLKLPLSHDQQDKSLLFLPNVLSKQISSPHSPRPSHTSHPPPSDNKLPLLNNMQAVAMVAVDTEQERFRVQNFGEGSPNKTRKRAVQPKAIGRSKSMQPVKLSEFSLGVGGVGGGVGGGGGHRRGSHEGSFHLFRKSDPTPPSKATFLPNVITPQLHGLFTGSCEGTRGIPQYGQYRQKGRGRLVPLTNKKSSPVQQPSSPLSMVTERTAESAEPTNSTTELHNSQDDSNNSTLKASVSGSEFDVDSLEKSRNIPAEPPVAPIPTPTILSPLEAQVLNLFPPTPGTAHHQSNLVINYARQEGNVPLSPIWNRVPSTDVDSSSNSEFITSYIGQSTTPSPREHEVYGVKRVGADSGQGESSSGEEGRSEGSDDTDSSEEERESLRWKRGRLLGKGAYGKVWEGLLDSGTLIAVKEVELDFVNLEKAQSQYEKIQLEVEILRSLRHKHIVKYLGTSLQEGLVFIFMDYISGGSLQSVLKRFGPLHYRNVSLYTKQITRALVYLHSNGIIHRDIKGANVMVTSRGVVKLIDFGCAKRYCTEGGTTGLHSVRGTPYWMSPEVICGHGYGRKSDIWSLGCTVHEMAVSKPPWADFPPESALFQIGLGKSLPQLPDHLSPVLVDFIHRCLTREQTDRPSALQLLEDPFLASTRKRSSTNSNR